MSGKKKEPLEYIIVSGEDVAENIRNAAEMGRKTHSDVRLVDNHHDVHVLVPYSNNPGQAEKAIDEYNAQLNSKSQGKPAGNFDANSLNITSKNTIRSIK